MQWILAPFCHIGMPTVLTWKGTIQALAADILLERRFIDPFVYAGATFSAIEVPLRFLGSGRLFGERGCLRAWLLAGGVNLQLRACLLEPGLKNWRGQALVHSGPAGTAMVAAAVWFPAVLAGLPRLGALFRQIVFVLSGLLALLSGCLAVDVAVFILKDLL